VAKKVIACRTNGIEAVNWVSRPGKQKACINGCKELPRSSPPTSPAEMGSTWNGPAANPMCCTEVGVACEKVNMVLLELYGWATFGSSGLSGY
jgi:hypothetical protein